MCPFPGIPAAFSFLTRRELDPWSVETKAPLSGSLSIGIGNQIRKASMLSGPEILTPFSIRVGKIFSSGTDL